MYDTNFVELNNFIPIVKVLKIENGSILKRIIPCHLNFLII